MGRPQRKIDKALFEQLCSLFMTQKEICYVLGVSQSTLIRFCHREYKHTFKYVYNGLIANVKYEIRKMQWKTAMQGDARMLIWLGKNYLGQTDGNHARRKTNETIPEYLTELQANSDLLMQEYQWTSSDDARNEYR